MAEQAGRRAAKNTSVRAVAELVGKFSTLILFAAIARSLGDEGLGVVTFAFAYLGIVMTPIGFGTDPLLLREAARDRAAIGRLMWDVLALKLAVAAPVLALGLLALGPLGYPGETRAVVAVMALGLLLDVLAKTAHAVFNAVERSELLAAGIVAQRLVTAGAGVAVLAAGGGLVAVAWVFTAGSVVHLAIAARGLVRGVGLPALRLAPRSWGALSGRSAPFAVQDLMTVLLFKLDAVLLSLMADASAVGRYGAAYRLLEATMFIGFALNGAFAAMYVYLDRRSDPTIGAVLGRSLKVALLLLVPVAVVLGTLAGPVCALVYGEELRGAGPALVLLAPVVVLLCLVTLGTALVISRRSPRAMVPFTGAMVLLNVGLNVVLVPSLEERGAALAMLITEAVFVLVVLRLVVRETGPLPVATLLAGPLVAGALMTAVALALAGAPLLAFVASGLVYLVVVVAVERRVAPDDLAFAVRLVRKRVGA